jgi:hypothetical protein
MLARGNRFLLCRKIWLGTPTPAPGRAGDDPGWPRAIQLHTKAGGIEIRAFCTEPRNTKISKF